jgi:hypothetical protein
MSKVATPLLVLLVWLFGASTAGAAAIVCGKPCVIEFSGGGYVVSFRVQGRDLANKHTPVIVDGPCLSACTVLLDEARVNVCITNRAVLGYHQSRSDVDGTYETLVYETPGLSDYLRAHGGEPQKAFLMVPFAQAKAFYQPCPGAD